MSKILLRFVWDIPLKFKRRLIRASFPGASPQSANYGLPTPTRTLMPHTTDITQPPASCGTSGNIGVPTAFSGRSEVLINISGDKLREPNGCAAVSRSGFNERDTTFKAGK